MCEDEMNNESFEDRVRAIAREVSRNAERMAQFDVDEIAEAVGLDPDRAREWVDSAGRWLRSQAENLQAENLGDDVSLRGTAPESTAADEDTLRSAAPHPLDLPTEEQGLALAALDSGRWTVEPGSNALAAHGEGPAPSDALGLVRELHARDWIAADGGVTLVGRHALSRWLDTAAQR
jgi:hypothetical protein